MLIRIEWIRRMILLSSSQGLLQRLGARFFGSFLCKTWADLVGLGFHSLFDTRERPLRHLLTVFELTSYLDRANLEGDVVIPYRHVVPVVVD